jgi:hypothetical protein
MMRPLLAPAEISILSLPAWPSSLGVLATAVSFAGSFGAGRHLQLPLPSPPSTPQAPLVQGRCSCHLYLLFLHMNPLRHVTVLLPSTNSPYGAHRGRRNCNSSVLCRCRRWHDSTRHTQVYGRSGSAISVVGCISYAVLCLPQGVPMGIPRTRRQR